MGSRGVCPSRFLARGGRVNEDIPCGYILKQVAHRERANMPESHLGGETSMRLRGRSGFPERPITVRGAMQQHRRGAYRSDCQDFQVCLNRGKSDLARADESGIPQRVTAVLQPGCTVSRCATTVTGRSLGPPFATGRLEASHGIACRGQCRHLPAYQFSSRGTKAFRDAPAKKPVDRDAFGPRAFFCGRAGERSSPCAAKCSSSNTVQYIVKGEAT